MTKADDLYAEGLALNQNGRPKDAIAKFEKAAATGHGPACAAMASVLADGQFVPQDLAAARSALERGWSAGHEQCGLHLSVFLAGGFGGAVSWPDAISLLLDLSSKGSLFAARELALLCASAGKQDLAQMGLAHAANQTGQAPDLLALALYLPTLGADPARGSS